MTKLFLALFPTSIVYLCNCFNEIVSVFISVICKKQNHSSHNPKLKRELTGSQS